MANLHLHYGTVRGASSGMTSFSFSQGPSYTVETEKENHPTPETCCEDFMA